MQSFDILKETISSIIAGNFDRNVLPLLRYCEELRQDTEIFTLLNPEKARSLLSQHKAAIFDILIWIWDEIPKAKKTEVGLLKIVKLLLIELHLFFSELMLEISN